MVYWARLWLPIGGGHPFFRKGKSKLKKASGKLVKYAFQYGVISLRPVVGVSLMKMKKFAYPVHTF